MTGELIKILAVCLIAGLMGVLLRPKGGEYTFLLAAAAGIFVLSILFIRLKEPFAEMADRLNRSGVRPEYFKVALKAVGIAYITDFIADLCRDSGQSSLAAKAELAGKAAIFLLTLPLLFAVLDTALGFLS